MGYGNTEPESWWFGSSFCVQKTRDDPNSIRYRGKRCNWSRSWWWLQRGILARHPDSRVIGYQLVESHLQSTLLFIWNSCVAMSPLRHQPEWSWARGLFPEETHECDNELHQKCSEVQPRNLALLDIVESDESEIEHDGCSREESCRFCHPLQCNSEETQGVAGILP